jgi:Reverse transcriptase (RNA-dependent DNA polymerase)
MAQEINVLAHNQTWTLVPSSLVQNVIGSKWVFKIKRNSEGAIERYKARLVAQGFNQWEGIDFLETCSPLIRPTTIRLVLSIIVSLQWPLRQLDVHNVFLHGNLSEQVYMSQPPIFIDPSQPHHACLLSKILV